MKVNIICDEPSGWIYGRFIEEFKRHSIHQILVNAKGGYDLVHYIPYYSVSNNSSHPSTAWFSHMESKSPLKEKFITAAQQVDFCFSHSSKYAEVLWNAGVGITKIKQVMPGVDLDQYKLFPNPPKRDRIVVGFVGRAYKSSNRKNPGLLERIAKEPGFELRVSGGKIKAEDMPKFYADLDIVVQPSLVEGGSMAILEGLACGKPILCYKTVGCVDEFDVGLSVEFGDEERFIQALKEYKADKWRDAEVRRALRKQVEQFTWERFVYEHDKVWSSL